MITTLEKSIEFEDGEEITILVQKHSFYPGVYRNLKIGDGWIEAPSFEVLYRASLMTRADKGISTAAVGSPI